MNQWRSPIPQGFNPMKCCAIVLFALLIVGFARVVKSQSLFPGQTIRERNRAMDEHDRTINRMKNDAKAANAAKERRRSLFPQINEDFQRIQVIHNEIVRMLQPDKSLDYHRLAELTDDMKKRGARLRENLALAEPEKTDTKPAHSETIDEKHMKAIIVALHDEVLNFVANPLFKNLGVVDAKIIDSATENLNKIIDLSDEIKREAKTLDKSSAKK